MAESEFLLHLPDLYHELGHFVLHNRGEDKLKHIGKCFSLTVEEITHYYDQLIEKKKRETGPKDIPLIIGFLHSQWKDWINEFFSDLFALYTLGLAFAWSHLHLTIKKCENVYQFSDILPSRHPADEARMRMLKFGLEIMGFKDVASSIMSKWSDLPLCKYSQPVTEYQYAYPDDLMKKVAELTYQGIKQSGFAIAKPERLRSSDEGTVTKMLNDAWRVFWEKPEKFRDWEKRNIDRLRDTLL